MDSHSVVGLLDAQTGRLLTNLVHHAQLVMQKKGAELSNTEALFGGAMLAAPLPVRYYVCTAASLPASYEPV